MTNLALGQPSWKFYISLAIEQFVVRDEANSLPVRSAGAVLVELKECEFPCLSPALGWISIDEDDLGNCGVTCTLGTTSVSIFGGSTEIRSADIWMNNHSSVDWSTFPLFDPGFDLFTAVSHELGHAVGLGHPRSTVNSSHLMGCSLAGASLTPVGSHDQDGVEYVYAAVGPSTTVVDPHPC